jgi:hypothetical protein
MTMTDWKRSGKANLQREKKSRQDQNDTCYRKNSLVVVCGSIIYF